MKFSICIPVYNVELYLKECLDSVLEQTFSDFEVICVNDGSTDKSLEILQYYIKKDKRIKIINKKNEGLLWARRDAIKFASGDYVLFLDSDDKYYTRDALKILSDKIEKYKNPDVLIFERLDLDNDSITIPCKHLFEEEKFFNNTNINEIRYFFITRNYLNAIILKCVKTSFIKKDHTDYSKQNPQMGEDIAQSIYFFDKCTSLVYLPQYLYVYRNNSSSITKALLSFSNLEQRIIRLLFVQLKMCIQKWKLEEEYEDIFQKFYYKVFSFYCERIIQLAANKNNRELIKNILLFDWFDENNQSFRNLKILKTAKLSLPFYQICKGLVLNRAINIKIGLIFVKLKGKI